MASFFGFLVLSLVTFWPIDFRALSSEPVQAIGFIGIVIASLAIRHASMIVKGEFNLSVQVNREMFRWGSSTGRAEIPIATVRGIRCDESFGLHIEVILQNNRRVYLPNLGSVLPSPDREEFLLFMGVVHPNIPIRRTREQIADSDMEFNY